MCAYQKKLFLLLSFSLVCVELESLAEEYCNWDVFQPRCSQNEILIINEAIYGRRKLGRCLKDEGTPIDNFLKDPKFLGCYVDVKHIIEPLCAGKGQCDVNVAKIKAETPCHKFYKLYLEVAYSCLHVVQENRHCSITASTDKKNIMTSSISTDGCGSPRRPWTIETLAGQRIRITSLPFMINPNSTNKNVLNFLSKQIGENYEFKSVGQVIDKNSRNATQLVIRSELLSSNDNEFRSDSNTVELTLDLKTIAVGMIIVVETTGCSDLIPPTDAWLKRTENEATIGCYSTRLRWQLKCVGQRWVGVIGNCSHGNQILISDSSPLPIENSPENSVVTIVGIAMVGFVICFLIICVGVVFLNRYYALSKSKVLKHMPLYNGDQTFRNTNGRPIDVQIKSFVDGFEGGTKIEQNFHDPKFQGEIETNQKYYELDHSLVKNEIFVN